MIVKNGEILAIDHIAHDNTLSGNGTSAKPVGLSQSTKDLIDSKVKKTDFETYKSSAANQISNINTKITTDESNFESYKSSAHNEIANFKSSAHDEIARVDASIAAVNAAKVDKTTFTQYQTDVANSFTAVNKRIDDVDAAKVNNTTFEKYQTDVTNNFTAVDKRIDDVDAAKVDNTTFDNFKGSANGELTDIKQSITDLNNAKQAKGDYVSASDFNNLKSSAHDEIERIDGRIDATNTNLSNNYYDRTTIDKKFADFGGYKFREPDPNNNNQPILNQGEDPDPKAIYLTQPEGATQYLQWIWDEEITEENKWKCIGDTTVDLKDYAKTVDVVASANANKQEIETWANNKFETSTDFNAVIANYYTKDVVDTKLATKADKTEVEQEFVDTSAWANATFATKIDLNNDKSELEGEINNLESKIEQDINNASADIINKIDTTSAYLDDKIEAVIDTLEDDYYTSEQIDTILAASGEYYTKTESDTKYTEKEVFNTAINELSSNKLDKSATANWDVTEYTEGENIKIVGHEISGKDWSNEIAAAIENKVDESELENYVTKTDFNKLDNKVGAIDDDLDILSGKTVSVIKDSETVKAIRSTEPDGTISYTLSAHDGKQADYLWKPTVNAAGDISWELALTGDTPDPANIKGPRGIQGVSGTPGKDGEDGITPKLKIDANNIWNVSYDNEATWTSLGVSATGPKGETGAQGPQGISGTPGKNGENGITPHIGNNNHWFIGEYDTEISATGPQGPAGTNGTNGKDGISPTVTTATIEGGNRVTFTYGEGSTEYIDVMSGIPGLPGVSPTVVTGDAVTSDAHKNGGTTITVTDNTGSQTFTAWNGNDGTMAGAPGITGYDGITARNTGTTYEIGLSSEFYTAITSVSSKLDESDFTTYTETTAPNTFQPKGDYATTQDISDMATETWVSDQGFLKNSALTDYATKSYANEASANALNQAESWVETEGYLKSVSVATNSSIDGTGTTNNPLSLKTSAENALKDVANKVAKPDTTQTELNNNYLIYSTLTDPTATTGWMPLSANYYSKSEADGRYQKKEDMSSYLTTAQYETDSAKYVLTGDILTATNNKLTGIKIGSTDYTVPTTDLSNYYTKSETSATGELNTEFAKKLDSTIAESTYQTKADMSAYLPLSGGTVTGQTTISGSAFDIFELKRSDQQGSTGIIGINGAGGMSFKIVNGNNNTQLNIAPNATMDKRFSIGDTPHQPAAYFIPAVTATTTDGLTDDGILHIILES